MVLEPSVRVTMAFFQALVLPTCTPILFSLVFMETVFTAFTSTLNSSSTVFSWMPELVTALGNYAKNRGKYQSISDFYPQLAKVLNKCLDTEKKRIDKALK